VAILETNKGIRLHKNTGHFGDISKENRFHIPSPKRPSPKRGRRTVPFRILSTAQCIEKDFDNRSTRHISGCISKANF